ncbi:hypothetical protein SCLCIDRAFT_1213881 [Scleroderma citrinum Foug A]|uniref:Uncharacterized protein n=1 Tax=Scleroderma citrinum Foug A TaxID=1036808 RepID=A0A0C3DTU0_9AGAM|nr:hypothetical protein SCLCIDRAFT_1213881 [Scleroderma citrinum Foug A]
MHAISIGQRVSAEKAMCQERIDMTLIKETELHFDSQEEEMVLSDRYILQEDGGTRSIMFRI